jgi:hypothetical protein
MKFGSYYSFFSKDSSISTLLALTTTFPTFKGNKATSRLAEVFHTCNISTWEAEAGDECRKMSAWVT